MPTWQRASTPNSSVPRRANSRHLPTSKQPKAARARLSADAQALGQLYDGMTPEEQHKLRLMLWVVKPGINPTHFPAPGPGHVDEPDSGLSNLDQPPADPAP